MNRYVLRILYFFFVFLFTTVAILCWKFPSKSSLKVPFFFPSPTSSASIPDQIPTFSKVVRVIDGDTIEIEDKKIVRYIGIDTPETKHPNKGVECFGKEASNFNTELVAGKTIRMEKDVSETDVYKRLLRYVWLVDSASATISGIFVNDYLVRQGYAYASTYPPDVQYSKQFIEAQREAQKNNRGLWNKCKK